MTWHQLLDHVRRLGQYATEQEAQQALDVVLGILGSQLGGDERCALATVLPERARATFVAPIPLTRPATAPAFVEAVARNLNTTLAQARWHTSTVLAALADAAGPDLTDRLLAHLPRGYAFLFGRADLIAAAA
ncbi:hypothetical protein CFP65_6563 [Kitasatospora sp. MMS16-BH015]|uniref:DUF2267 domain-containing protein n=1 Tax=Kitasatospora sp. MMS16-BH015 TaxID=2018025 RepID=UPI000CA27B91|nr:DUF2267 domain-containing protein [Kitasatospora sp. MMS16-BH015]AUG81212.1 hypothetical protein CFP65_6563 [Kitasatospora sp. MMS16-BH015]